jgi:DNA-binding LytR/AlgR family response regulator
MMKIAICDDDVKELNKTKDLVNAYSIRHAEYGMKIILFTSPVELLQHISQLEQFDIILLDIYLPEMTGIELAHTLRGKNEELQIIFLTNSFAHAIEAFSLHAAHYLVKPITSIQLDDALTKAIRAIENIMKAQIVLKTSNGLQKINYTDYVYSETEAHIQKIYLINKNNLNVRISCCDLFGQLSHDDRFFKCGSTYILNLERIKEVSAHCILFENEMQIPMQRRQYKELIYQYTKYSLEGNY